MFVSVVFYFLTNFDRMMDCVSVVEMASSIGYQRIWFLEFLIFFLILL